MSRQAQLPPRCPLQKKHSASSPIPLSLSSCKGTESHHGKRHNKSMSQSSILEDHPSWLNDLLNESNSNSNSTGIMLRRAASDSSTLFNSLVPLQGLDQPDENETLDTCETDNTLESSCTYGPNSPRSKNKQSFPGKQIVSAFSEYVVQNPLQHIDGHMTASGVPLMDSFSDACASADVIDDEGKSMKRHPGQRSRVRKLQYIAELERAVNVLQNLGSDLSVRVASLLQQHVALSMENNTLKNQLLRMQQEKFIVDGEYQSLKEQLKRLKTGTAFSNNTRKVHKWPNSAANSTHSDAIWDMIDIGKLNLN